MNFAGHRGQAHWKLIDTPLRPPPQGGNFVWNALKGEFEQLFRIQKRRHMNTNPNAEIIERFYSCFQKLDGDGMAQCYHEDVVFSDPVFPELRGAKAGAMWKMLCSQAKEFELTFSDVQADATNGRAHWEAKYVFSTTGRNVHNKINASFRFQDGKIIHHNDSFHFWTWSFMALERLDCYWAGAPWSKIMFASRRRKILKDTF